MYFDNCETLNENGGQWIKTLPDGTAVPCEISNESPIEGLACVRGTIPASEAWHFYVEKNWSPIIDMSAEPVLKFRIRPSTTTPIKFRIAVATEANPFEFIPHSYGYLTGLVINEWNTYEIDLRTDIDGNAVDVRFVRMIGVDCEVNKGALTVDVDWLEVFAGITEMTLTILPCVNGRLSLPEGDHPYNESSTVYVTAVPDAGFALDYFVLDGVDVGKGAPVGTLAVVMDTGHELYAVFIAVVQGYLSVTSNEVATITVEGVAGSWETPTGLITLEVGTYTVHATAIGQTKTKGGVVISDGVQTPLDFEFIREGYTPLTYDLESGTYEVSAEPTGFRRWNDGITMSTREVIISEGQELTLTAIYEVFYTITITSTDGGITDPSGTTDLQGGETYEITAAPAEGYEFDHWELNGETFTENPLFILAEETIDGKTLTAYFTKIWVLTITSTEGGITDPSGEITVDEPQVVTVTAVPDEGYRFDRWELDDETRTENPINITMDKDYSLHAVFQYVGVGIATIKGHVTDAETKNPIQGASVVCNGYADITEVDGYYELTEIPGAPYTLTVTKEGYEIQTYPIDMSEGDVFTKDFELTPKKEPPETLFDQVWSRFEEFLKSAGLPVPPKPPQPPPLPLE